MAVRYQRQYRPVGSTVYTDGQPLSVRDVRDLIENAQGYHGRSAPRLLVYDLNFPIELVASDAENFIAEYWVPVPRGLGSAEFTTIEWKLWAYLANLAVTTTVRVYSHTGFYRGVATPFAPASLGGQSASGSLVVNSTTPQWWSGTTPLIHHAADQSTRIVLTFDDAAPPTAGLNWGFFAAWLQPLVDV